ncbi:hypothetical protein HY638_05500 [Candidatus Woesearchaeota archaeon]|nr:hypothetical protein [Candidatus Woesearchaeota archaeon]
MRKIIFLAIIFVLIIGCSGKPEKSFVGETIEEGAVRTEEPIKATPEEIKENSEKEPVEHVPVWKNAGVAISGKYADADIVDVGGGKYRMYYSEEPEVPGFRGQVYSALSGDGINWNKEDGERMDGATFPSVIKLPDGAYRMYFQNNGVIKSAISSDGLSWKAESGARIGTSNSAGLKLSSVLAPTVIKSGNGYILVYAGAINEKYPEKVPNNEIHLFLWATSADGLDFKEMGIALDSRNDEFKGWLDGAEFTQWDDGSLRLYFWSYKGIYHTTYKNGLFSRDAVFDYTTNGNPLNQFPENPPGDPTLAKISGKWLMYYGQHTKGIYYASLG